MMNGSKAHDEDPADDLDSSTLEPSESDENEHGGIARSSRRQSRNSLCKDIVLELWHSSGLVLNHKLNWLLVLGPVALMGDATGFLGETLCFAFSGMALIPCAERLSFVTEQVAMHTNGTIGALLNATFGNAPELLIASAALRKGFYRVVQLAMLGSMLTNLLFVFGISCLIGGLRWQVQELRITSGNVSVGMLLLSTAGSLLPATLVLGGQLRNGSANDGEAETSSLMIAAGQPTVEELQFCRVNAFVMILMYGCYLVFQLGTHKEEFDEHEPCSSDSPHLTPHPETPQRNLFCVWLVRRAKCILRGNDTVEHELLASEEEWMAAARRVIPSEQRNGNVTTGDGDVELMYRDAKRTNHQLLGMIPSERDSGEEEDDEDASSSDEECLLPTNFHANGRQMAGNSDDLSYFDDYLAANDGNGRTPFLEPGAPRLRRGTHPEATATHPTPTEHNRNINNDHTCAPGGQGNRKKKKNGMPGVLLPLGLAEPTETVQTAPSVPQVETNPTSALEVQMSFRVGILWLFIITLGISAMSDILVNTIDGFAIRMHFSEVFTSMIIVPFFSNVAEQVSAILFAYRNEMDLCVGVTVGSAIQVASLVLPGCVIIGWMVDRSMTLYFHAYETVCIFFAVIVIAAVLQGGTTNWLVGATCISVYVMMATGFWFHSLEEVSVDAESVGLDSNATRRALFL
mmetsp:Transcript_8323/g.20565  ORF Transcript_8323/g.20565 Transcript_8323/m.20565 type:complete len:688 (-) Transcript_8323:800-2863(-)